MAQVKAMSQCFVDNSLRNEGDVFEYNGPPSRILIPVGTKSDKAEADEPKVKQKWSPKAKRDAEDLG